MFLCIRRQIPRPLQILFKRFIQNATSEKLLTPSFNVDDIKDLPYNDNVKLASRSLLPYKTKIDKKRTPVLFLHGIFGSIRDFNKLGRAVSWITFHPCYAVDIRNHGESPNALPFTYMSMVYDVYRFIQEKKWDKCIIVGFEMGAKIAAILSLLYPNLVSKLVLIENTPHAKKLDDCFYKGLLGMCEVEVNEEKYKGPNNKLIKKISQVDRFLADYVKDDVARNLLMSDLLKKNTNIKKRGSLESKKEAFNMPVMNFYKYNILDTVGGWPRLPELKKFWNPVLVISGKQSDFILPEYHNEFKRYFTDIRYKELDCGHWIQREKSRDLCMMLARFVDRKSTLPQGFLRWK